MPPAQKNDDLRPYLTAIAQPVRFDILRMLKGGELCVCDIYEELGIAQNLASHHLKVLTDLHLLTSRKCGLKVLYQRNEQILTYYQTLLTHTITRHENTSHGKRVQNLQDVTRARTNRRRGAGNHG